MQRLNFGDHPVVVSALEGTDSTQEFQEGSRHYLESATRVPDSEWVVWVGLDMNEVMAPVHSLRNLLIISMAAAALLACAIAIWSISRLMQPLTALGLRTGQIADGHYNFNFRPSGFAEIDTLANQIKNMSHAIKVREESIITNEQRFRDLVNSIDGIVWEMEYPSFRFLFVSRQAEAVLGYPIQDWYEKPSFWEKKVHVEDMEQAKAYCQLMSEKHEDHDFEYRMVAANGRVVWIRDLVTVVVEDNRPVRLLGVMIDVTAQKELVEELSRSEQNYREIFNSTSDAILIHDAETGQVMDVNQSMLNMFNCSYEMALVGDAGKFSMGERPYSQKDAQLKLQKALAEGSCTFEWHSRKVTGELFWTEVNLRSAMIGNQQRILAAVRDISERKEAAEKLREANERLLLLINRMPLGCVFWTPDFIVDMWNPAAESIFGFTEEEMVGRGPYGTIVPEQAQTQVEMILDRLREGDLAAHSLNKNITKNGKIISCEWYNTPVQDSSGKIIGTISMVQDVSERKATEDELAKYRAGLESLVSERTEQLQVAQEELVQKERLAVLGQLTATVSHEIRNPLGTVANALYMLKDSLSGKEHAHLERPLQLAERNVERCDGIISDLLDFSRQRKIQREPIDIDVWVAEILSEFPFPDEVQCHRDLSSQATVPADSERLRRVVVNVVTNALQALDEVQIVDKKVEVQTRIIANRCELSVRDNGPGMSEEILSRIFEPMFSTKNFGVGLGVPIIKNILEGHGGGVEYSSEVGRGTTVTMWLPLEDERIK
jgi:PAS domain S-box-containing protein